METQRIINVRTGIHKDFHRLVVELSGRIEHSIERGSDFVSIRMHGVEAAMPLGRSLSTDVIRLNGFTRSPVAFGAPAAPIALDVVFKEGTSVKESVRQNPFRIVVDFYPE